MGHTPEIVILIGNMTMMINQVTNGSRDTWFSDKTIWTLSNYTRVSITQQQQKEFKLEFKALMMAGLCSHKLG